MPRKILVVNWFLYRRCNYRPADWKFTPQLMAVIIRVNNGNTLARTVKSLRVVSFFNDSFLRPGKTAWNWRRFSSLSGTLYSSCADCGKLSGTSLLTNKVSRGTLSINHLPNLHKGRVRDKIAPRPPRATAARRVTHRPLWYFEHLAHIDPTCPPMIDLLAVRVTSNQTSSLSTWWIYRPSTREENPCCSSKQQASDCSCVNSFRKSDLALKHAARMLGLNEWSMSDQVRG